MTTQLPNLTVTGSWESILLGQDKAVLEQLLPGYMLPRRWFGAKARAIQSTKIIEVIPSSDTACFTLVQVNYADGEPETYMLPLAFATAEQAKALQRERPGAVVALLQTPEASGVLYDAVWENRFCQALLETIGQQQQLNGAAGTLVAEATRVFPQLCGPAAELPPTLLGVEQSNTSIRYGDRLILKLFRRAETGVNPDLEIGHFLTEKAAFTHIPPVAGALEYRREQHEPVTVAILQGFVPNQGDAWRYTLEALEHYFERVLTQTQVSPEAIALSQESLLEVAQQDMPRLAIEMIGTYLESAQLLGQRSAELHLALASDSTDPSFAPEPFTASDQHPLYQSMHNLTRRSLQLLRQRLNTLPQAAQIEAQQVLELEPEMLKCFHSLLEHPLTALRTRTHGDYHLGQVLYTGQDFMIIDFEGEPARSLAERRLKKSPWQDVAGMLRSFHYAAYAAFFEQVASAVTPAQNQTALEAWTRFWHRWVSAAFLKTYLHVAAGAPFLPPSTEELKILLKAYLLEKAVYELGYELNNRPDWVKIPLQGILQTL
jgi:maltose alpha-D-glucosyltransferase/alpha-amylase